MKLIVCQPHELELVRKLFRDSAEVLELGAKPQLPGWQGVQLTDAAALELRYGHLEHRYWFEQRILPNVPGE